MYEFFEIWWLVRNSRLLIRFLFIGSRLCCTLLSEPASRRRPCASLSLHFHQVVKGTSTPKLWIMLGAPKKGDPLRDRPVQPESELVRRCSCPPPGRRAP